MDDYGATAAEFADSARAAIALLRATMDEREDDAQFIMTGVNPYRIAYQIANLAVNSGMTSEFLEWELHTVNAADADGSLERIARERNIILASGKETSQYQGGKLTGFTPIGQTSAGQVIGTVDNCPTCARCKTCCQGKGTCVIIRHPTEEEIIQHLTVLETCEIVAYLIAAAGKAE